MKNLFVLIAVLLGFLGVAYSQRLQKTETLSTPKMNAEECTVAINPKNSDKVVAASNINFVYRSKNGGKSFSSKKVNSPLGFYGDPVLLYDEFGNCYIAHLSQDKSKTWPESFDQIVVQKSNDDGKSWSKGVGIGKNGKMHDKPWLSVDRNQQSPFKNNVYLTWTEFDKYESKNPLDSSRILFSRSNDFGKTFSAPICISDKSGDCADSDFTVEGATTATGPHGEVYALWAGHENLYLDVSFDGGGTWGRDKVVCSINKGWDIDIPEFYRTNGLPFLSCNKRGTLYACSVKEDAGKNKVFYIHSKDGGNTWSEKKFIEPDAETQTIMPHAYLDYSTGNYYIIYYALGNNKLDVKLAYLLDGESQWTYVQLNDQPLKIPGKKIFFGDYIGVCGLANQVSAVWTELEQGHTVVKHRRVVVE